MFEDLQKKKKPFRDSSFLNVNIFWFCYFFFHINYFWVVDKTVSSGALGNNDGHFPYFFHFLDQIRKIINRLIINVNTKVIALICCILSVRLV